MRSGRSSLTLSFSTPTMRSTKTTLNSQCSQVRATTRTLSKIPTTIAAMQTATPTTTATIHIATILLTGVVAIRIMLQVLQGAMHLLRVHPPPVPTTATIHTAAILHTGVVAMQVTLQVQRAAMHQPRVHPPPVPRRRGIGLPRVFGNWKKGMAYGLT